MIIEPVSDPSSQGFDASTLARIDRWMQRSIDTGRYSGSSVLIARNGEIVHLATAGLRSMDTGHPYEHDTIVRIYSMTKPVTSVALMMHYEQGLLHLGTPISAFLPEFSRCHALVDGATRIDQTEEIAPPTLHQLLTHTSGMTYDFNPGLLSQHYAEHGIGFGPATGGLEIAVKRAAAMPLAFRPGSRWEYSVGIDIIGRVIEVITGQPLDQVLQTQIFEPLGMVDTAFSVPDEKVARFADCYLKTETENLHLADPAGQSEFLAPHVETFSGGGGLVSTLGDYFRFGEMLRCGGSLDGVRLLSPRTVAFVRSNHLAGDIASMGPRSFAEMPMEGFGFGIGGSLVLSAGQSGMIGSVGDFGWGGLASTYFWTDPVEQLTGVFFTQLMPSSSYPSRAELKALVHGALVG